ncbi:glycine cleavage T C-terminal barrel domain-containing protein [Microbacterium sp. M3]|uniref:Glycine cleavage T C-terminal barrel domain-containing protein n=1 Tax=Microbacterium arthrosphaerae TaxID=792652 RepID=A0ABU4GWM9_9MICO|nr:MULTISPECIES: glycine cleavage T C-terminal barrel domain-containing protein [Microbacterium]MDW4571481.1 glycine cleavage T C-terminal barrel domain-containing protein [Microbacterium arthrosphaerae]MDW7605336.1 glycine cleavage T C-terminal barrel domain-containing protein [Microbacterium sp. M3]
MASAAPGAPFAAIPGAVVDEAGLQHVGSPLIEQRRLAAGAALAPLGDRAVIAVPGEDRLSWLDSLSSQALTRLAPGVGTELLILDPHGHVEHAASVIDDGETAWLIADRADVAGLHEWLRKMRFRLRVDPRIADEYAVVGGAAAAVERISPTAPSGLPLVWRDPWPDVSPGGHAYAAVDPHPGAERDWAEAIVTRDEEQRIADAATRGELELAGLTAVDALRVAAWRPRWTTDVDERALPHELDWLRTAVHLDKGCYRGQETIAKVHNLGHPPRRLVALQLDGSGSVLPAHGAVVRHGEAEVGVVTSAALHFEEGPIALAVVRRSLAVDAALTVDTADGPVAAAQEVVVPPDAGATANVPRITRLSRRAAAQ